MDILKNLRIDPTILLFNGILFLVLVQVLDKLFWKPMLRHLEGRKESISNAYRTVDQTQREIEDLRAQYQSWLARIEADTRGRIQETVKDAQRQREEIIMQARADSEEIVRQGAASLEQEKADAVARMREDLDRVAGETLARVTGAPASAGQRALIDEYIAQNVVRQ